MAVLDDTPTQGSCVAVVRGYHTHTHTHTHGMVMAEVDSAQNLPMGPPMPPMPPIPLVEATKRVSASIVSLLIVRYFWSVCVAPQTFSKPLSAESNFKIPNHFIDTGGCSATVTEDL